MPEPSSAASPVPAGPPIASWQLHLPNVLTSLRVVSACVFFGALSVWSYTESPAARGAGPDWWLIGSAALFLLAAATDALDGYLARRWRVVSVFGRIMDPFADKVLVIGAFVFLAAPAFQSAEGVQVSGVAAWMVAVILARELLVTSIRGAMEGSGVSFGAAWSGKAKMILQSISIPAVLVIVATVRLEGGGWRGWQGVVNGLMWGTVIVTVWSGLPYVSRALGAARTLGAAGTGAKG